MSMLINSFQFEVGGSGGSVEYFRAGTNTTQVLPISPSTTEINFPMELDDANNLFSSNRYTVPANQNGYYALLEAGYKSTAQVNQECSIEIQRSRDGGSNWTTLVAQNSGYRILQFGTSTMVVLATGDVYRVRMIITSGGVITLANDPLVYFNGTIWEPIP